MQIDPLGDGLRIVIECEATGLDNFLAFSCWYSLSKNLPDADVTIACKRPETPSKDVFPWVYRLGIPFFYYSKNHETEGKVLKMTSDVVCLSPLDRECLDRLNDSNQSLDLEKICRPAKDSEPSVFSTVKNGCGSFVPSKWIDNGGHPFGKLEIFSKGSLTANEVRIFSLWKKLRPVYENLV